MPPSSTSNGYAEQSTSPYCLASSKCKLASTSACRLWCFCSDWCVSQVVLPNQGHAIDCLHSYRSVGQVRAVLELIKAQDEQAREMLALQSGRITSIKQVGMGDRCILTQISRMRSLDLTLFVVLLKCLCLLCIATEQGLPYSHRLLSTPWTTLLQFEKKWLVISRLRNWRLDDRNCL